MIYPYCIIINTTKIIQGDEVISDKSIRTQRKLLVYATTIKNAKTIAREFMHETESINKDSYKINLEEK